MHQERLWALLVVLVVALQFLFFAVGYSIGFGEGLGALIAGRQPDVLARALQEGHAPWEGVDWAFLGGFVQWAFAIVLGGAITMWTALWVERAERPKLELRVAESESVEYGEEHKPAKGVVWVNLMLVNLPPRGRFEKHLPRQVAEHCIGEVAIFSSDGRPIFEKPMPVRWSDSLQPVPSSLSLPNGQFLGFLFDPNTISAASWTDVPPGEDKGKILNLAAQFDEDEDAYGWSNESYRSTPMWRNPKTKIPPGAYSVTVTIWSGVEKHIGSFRLINEGARSKLRLSSPSQTVQDVGTLQPRAA